MSATAVTGQAGAAAQRDAAGRTARWRAPWRNPWRRPWLLEGFTWLYLIWSLVPIAIAVLFSFNNGKSQATWQGFSWRWYFTDPVNSVLHSNVLQDAVLQTLRLSVYTTLIAVPLGVALFRVIRYRTGAPRSRDTGRSDAPPRARPPAAGRRRGRRRCRR
jgi:ABC-type Fe3+ transport system permease subunit